MLTLCSLRKMVERRKRLKRCIMTEIMKFRDRKIGVGETVLMRKVSIVVKTSGEHQGTWAPENTALTKT